MLLFLLPIVFRQHVADLVDRLYIHSIVYSIIENERGNSKYCTKYRQFCFVVHSATSTSDINNSNNNNNSLNSVGHRKKAEYVIDDKTGERIRPKTFLEQTGKRKPHKHSKKVQQQIEWRRNTLSQLL